MLDKNKIKSQLAAGESVGTVVGRELAKRVKHGDDLLRAELDALADELHAQRAEVVGLKTRVAVLEAAQEKSK
jgi:hypothetical protein